MNKIQAARLLSDSGWLSRQPEGFQAELIQRSRLRRFEAGQTVLHAGEAAQGIIGLAEGRIELSLRSGRLATILRTGFWFGEAATLASIGAPVSVRAVHRSFLLVLSIAEFEAMVVHSASCRSFAKLAVEHLVEMIGVLEHLTQQAPRARVAGRLLALAQSKGEAACHPLRITQDELAAMCALSRQTINKIVREFAVAGILSLNYRSINLRNVAALRVVAQDHPASLSFAENPT